MIRFNFLYWLTLLFCLTSVSAYAQGGAGNVKHPDEMLDYKALLPSSEGAYAEIQPLFGQVTLQACQAGEVRLKPVTLVIPEDALPEPHTVFVQYYPGVAPNDMLPEDVINLTHQGGHVRMTPSDIYHEGQLLLSIKVEADQLPAWGDAHDIVGLQFSAQTGWSQVNLYQWDAKAQVATFLTDPFAEFIAGIIQTPELSPTAAIVSTEIKDYKTPPPHEGISMIEPPSPNNMGSANLSYPIEIPPGRAGMQPNLSINYNSDGGNGWMGMGWDLSVPSISIDTRWGVPLYDPEMETETYTFQGQMLYPVAHRGDRVNREANRVFHPRVEGAFAEVIRHGGHPSEYWWEVIEKNGRRRFYGASKASQEVLSEATLSSADGNIAKWFLVEEWDVNGNVIKYTYREGSSVDNYDSNQLYIDEIIYTGHEEEEGTYKVLFETDKEISPDIASRVDASVNCRLGFASWTAELCKRIIVKYESDTIRTYEFNYLTSSLAKSLLQNISVYDAENNVFYKNSFSYYDDITDDSELKPFQNFAQARVPDDTLKGGLTVTSLPIFSNELSALGSSFTSNLSYGGSFTVGAPGLPVTKTNTVGGNYSRTKGKGYGRTSLVDINGDNRPDKVLHQGGNLFYRPNLGFVNDEITFGEKTLIEGVNHFSSFTSEGHTRGFEANIKPVGLGKGKNKSTTTTDTYFSDFNNDGIIDIARKGTVYFGLIDDDGELKYSVWSSSTPNRIDTNSEIDPSLLANPGEDQQTLEQEFPLHDLIQSWQAPKSGTICIKAPITYLPESTEEFDEYLQRDGISARIEYKGNNGILLDAIDSIGGGYSTDTFDFDPILLDIQQYEHIYFRLQSRTDGNFDRVLWNPKIEYIENNCDTPLSPDLDSNNRDINSYEAKEDFHLFSPQSLVMPIDGVISIESSFSKPVTSDNIVVEVIKTDTLMNSDTLLFELISWDTDSDGLPLLTDTVRATDELSFRIRCHTNIDWSGIKWKPVVTYTYSDSVDVYDQNDNPRLQIAPAVEADIYGSTYRMNSFEMPETGVIELHYTPFNTGFSFIHYVEDAPPSLITLSLKGQNKLYGKSSGYIESSENGFFDYWTGSLEPLPPLQILDTIPEGEELFVEIHVENGDIASYAANLLSGPVSVHINGEFHSDTLPGLYSKQSSQAAGFGPKYRGWGRFVYNGNEERQDSLIIEEELYLDEDDYDEDELDNIEDIDNNDDLDEYENAGYDPVNKIMVYMLSDPANNRWIGADDLTYLQCDTISSSRFGEDNVLPPRANNETSSTYPAPVKKTRNTGDSYSVSGGLSGFSSGLSLSEGRSDNIMEVMDFNGDGYLDIVKGGKIQYTSYTGGLEQELKNFPTSTSHYSKSSSISASNSASPTISTSSNDLGGGGLFVINIGRQGAATAKAAQQKAKTSASLSGSISSGSDETERTCMDINGDGLPDIINKDGRVNLNIGYDFLSAREWGFSGIRNGGNIGYNGGLGISIANNSIAAGISLNSSTNSAHLSFQDVTGDGLLDRLSYDPESGLINLSQGTGTSFLQPVPWLEGEQIDEGNSVGESANASFTVRINFLFFSIAINPSVSKGIGFSRQQTQFGDINNDGFPDFLKSTADDNLTYALSTIGRTNKLKTISGPLGSEMTLDYEVIPSSYENPNPQWVLSTVETNDGYTHDGANTQKTTFEYKDGYKDRREREFYGFSKVVSHSHDTENEDAVYRTTIQHYANDTYYRKGLLLADTLMDAAGALYTTTEYEYELRAPLASSVQTLPNGFSADDSLAYPAQRRMSRAYYEGQAEAGLIHTTRYDYDLKGNTILYTDEGSGAPEEEVQAVIQYHSLDSLGVYSIPRDMQVIDYEGTVLRHRACEVYPENGNIKTIRQYYTSAEAAVFDYEYDDYGNITKVTRPENINGERMTYEFTYDDEVNTYVVATNDAYGYSSSATYDYRFGVPLTTTDLNDNQMVFAYDTKGRLTHLTGPYELASGAPYTIKMEYFPEAEPAYSICRHYNEDTNSDILTVTFVDGLGRPVQVKKSGLLYQSSTQADQAVMNVSGKIIYDAFGREVATYYPVSEAVGDTTAINTQEDTEAAPTEVTYDVLDRKLKTTLPDATETVMHYEISDPPGGGSKAFATFTEDALGNTTEVYTDVRGRQLSTVAYGPDGPITTSFTYNAIAEVLTVTDVAGNTTTFTYDMLGRQTSIDHPVNGLTELFYDPLGNITRKLTANLRDFFGEDSGILYDYDYERPIRITYPLNYQNKVEYVYGSATDSTFNRRGKVVLQRDASGAQEFFYGPMGEITKTIRTVVLNPTEIRTYVSEARYDSWNRIQQLFYPDGEVVDYAYNAAGKLTRLSGERLGESYAYVDRISYDKFEKRRYIQFGNNTEQEYQYDPDRQWLDKMNARTEDRDFMDVDYAYDAVANILSVTNIQEPAEGQIGGAYTHNYTYDELYRIYSAEGSWVRGNRQEAYTLDMEFDNTHNILSKNQVRTRNGQPVFNEANYMQTYQYEAGRPFVPSKVGRFQYDHDLNGNLLSVTDTTSLNLKEYEWDEENRLTAVIDNGYVSHYTYDATGERVIKSHGPVTGQAFNGSDNGFIDHRSNYTAYINPEFVARQGSYTKHYFIEGQRICSKIGQGQFNNNSAEFGQGTLTAGSIDYVTWLSQVRANELDYYGDSLTVSHPTMPFRYVVPDSTGESYPDLLPNAIVVTTPQSSIYVLPAQPDLSGNSQAGAPVWGTQDSLSADSIRAGYGMTDTIGLPREVLQYFYHSDHVGSTAYITDRNGNVSQYAVYTAFGELFVEDQLLDVDDSQPYLFNGKELDRETGLYYYGARYYEPISSMWMSVDPLANKYPGWSPYCYTMLNPVRLVDPDGKEVITLAAIFLGGMAIEGTLQTIDLLSGRKSIEDHSSLKSIGKMVIAGTLDLASLGASKFGKAAAIASNLAGGVIMDFANSNTYNTEEVNTKIVGRVASNISSEAKNIGLKMGSPRRAAPVIDVITNAMDEVVPYIIGTGTGTTPKRNPQMKNLRPPPLRQPHPVFGQTEGSRGEGGNVQN